MHCALSPNIIRILYPENDLIKTPGHVLPENYVARILQKYIIFGVSDTHPSIFLKIPSNIASKIFKNKRQKTLD